MPISFWYYKPRQQPRSAGRAATEYVQRLIHGYITWLFMTRLFITLAVSLFPVLIVHAETMVSQKSPVQQFKQGVCGQTILSSVQLSQDLVNCNGDGIVIGADDVVVDGNGHVISGTGSGNGVKATDHSRVVIANTTIRNFKNGIKLASKTDYKEPTKSRYSKISANVIEGNNKGILLFKSSDISITKNRIVGNSDSGIVLSASASKFGPCSDNVKVLQNIVRHNTRGLSVYCSYLPESGLVIEQNSFVQNLVAVTDVFKSEERVRYRSNTFSENVNTVFFRYHGDHRLQAGSRRSFDVAIHRSDGSVCADFDIIGIGTSPEEKITYTKNGNRITGSFTPRRRGLYSLYFEVAGCGQQRIGQRFWFGREETTTLFLQKGKSRDEGKLVPAAPLEQGRVWCTMWIQASPTEPLVKAGIAKTTKVETLLWSRYIDPAYPIYRNLYGLEFGRTFSRRGDVFVPVDKKYPEARTLITETIAKGYWIHEPKDWRRLALKYVGRDPEWLIGPEAPSSVKVSYILTEHPLVLEVAGSRALILSATSPVNLPGKAEIIITGDGETRLLLEMGNLGDYHTALDGVPCDQNEACRVTWHGTQLAIQVNATATHRVTMQATSTASGESAGDDGKYDEHTQALIR